MKVAGQIASLDSFGEHVAIGSAVVQVVKTSYSQPKRMIYRKAKDGLMVFNNVYACHKFKSVVIKLLSIIGSWKTAFSCISW